MKKLITLLSLAVVGLTFGQEEEPKLSFSGSVDAYYRANLDAPNDENAIAPGSSFANLSGFSLGMANIVASYEASNVGVVADLVFGPRGTDAVFASPMNSNSADIINQLYAYWNVSEKVTLTMGNFNTFLGYEVISPVGNFNYSTSYLFSYGPFSHTGIKADFDFGDELTLMTAIMNPTDLTEYNPTGDYAVGIQFGFKGQYLNYLASQGAYEVDFTGGIDFSDSFKPEIKELNSMSYARSNSNTTILPDGNIFINEGGNGRYFEVNGDKDIVWQYINPVSFFGNAQQGEEPPNGNSSFRAYKYPMNHPAFVDKDLTPQYLLEGEDGRFCENPIMSNNEKLTLLNINLYADLSDNNLVIRNEDQLPIKYLTLYNLMGQKVASHQIESIEKEYKFPTSPALRGIYIANINMTNGRIYSIKIYLQ